MLNPYAILMCIADKDKIDDIASIVVPKECDYILQGKSFHVPLIACYLNPLSDFVINRVCEIC